MNIVTFGLLTPGSTVAHRADALRRLGHHVLSLNPDDFVGCHGFLESWVHFRTGYRLLQSRLFRRLSTYFINCKLKPDLVWIDSGEYLGPRTLLWLRRSLGCPILLYCNDDPTGPRDWLRFASLRRALPFYDLCVYRREVNELEWLALGARRVLRVWMSYDELIHRCSHVDSPQALETIFIGTNMPSESRGQFLYSIVSSGVPLTIYGSRWQRSSYWPSLQPFVKGGSLADTVYSKRLAHSALCLGMLSIHNRDLHTRRSVEVPASGSTLLAERTSEHKLLYEESVDALFWSSETECIRLCQKYLSDQADLLLIRASGHRRVLSLGVGNQDICNQILSSMSLELSR
jgi:spore maturation protein CgeB